MSRPLRVFLCHASQDKRTVRELYNALKAEDWIDPWLDEEKISFGQHWATAIEEALDSADVVLIFLSRNSVHKEGFVQRELNYAWDLSLEKPHEVIFLIPVRLDDCEIPRFLSLRQWGDYFGDKKESTHQILFRSLKTRYEQKLHLEEAGWKASENATLEKAKRESAEKIARERSKREQLQWEVAQKAVLEKKQRDAAQKAEKKKPANNSLLAAFGGFGILVIFGILAIMTFFATKWFSPPPTVIATPGEIPIVVETSTLLSTVSPDTTETSTPTETPLPEIGSTMTGADGMKLIYIPAGEFTMGSDKGDLDERPFHKVNLGAFWIDQTEVTNKMYSLCVAAGECELPAYTSSSTHFRYYDNTEFNHHPVIYVDWNMAKTYCEWAGRDLPTEPQWEKAARGPDATKYPWGNIFDGALVNFCDTNCSFDWANKSFNDDYADVAPVGKYPSGESFYHIYDMAGNVWEWTKDWYDVYPGGNPGVSSNFGQKYHVLRGGSWYVNMDDVRSADRYWVDLSDSFNYFTGFRCALSP